MGEGRTARRSRTPTTTSTTSDRRVAAHPVYGSDPGYGRVHPSSNRFFARNDRQNDSSKRSSKTNRQRDLSKRSRQKRPSKRDVQTDRQDESAKRLTQTNHHRRSSKRRVKKRYVKTNSQKETNSEAALSYPEPEALDAQPVPRSGGQCVPSSDRDSSDISEFEHRGHRHPGFGKKATSSQKSTDDQPICCDLTPSSLTPAPPSPSPPPPPSTYSSKPRSNSSHRALCVAVTTIEKKLSGCSITASLHRCRYEQVRQDARRRGVESYSKTQLGCARKIKKAKKQKKEAHERETEKDTGK